jgi:hypothetical protein
MPTQETSCSDYCDGNLGPQVQILIRQLDYMADKQEKIVRFVFENPSRCECQIVQAGTKLWLAKKEDC